MRVVFYLLMLVVTTARVGAYVRGPYQPYVQTSGNGDYYARCIPTEQGFGHEGTQGTTDIYKVEKEKDRLIDHYDWYSPEHILLHAPENGKVAVMSLFLEAHEPSKQVEFRFYLSGKLLKTYTTQDLISLGVELRPNDGFNADKTKKRADITSYEIRLLRRPGSGGRGYPSKDETSKIAWLIRTRSGRELFFDMLSGDLIEKE